MGKYFEVMDIIEGLRVHWEKIASGQHGSQQNTVGREGDIVLCHAYLGSARDPLMTSLDLLTRSVINALQLNQGRHAFEKYERLRWSDLEHIGCPLDDDQFLVVRNGKDRLGEMDWGLKVIVTEDSLLPASFSALMDHQVDEIIFRAILENPDVLKQPGFGEEPKI